MPGNRNSWGFTVSEDLNPETREISPMRGYFHELSITSRARGRQEFRRPSRFPGRVPRPGRGRPDATTAVTLCAASESGQAKYPPFWTAAQSCLDLPAAVQIGVIWLSVMVAE